MPPKDYFKNPISIEFDGRKITVQSVDENMEPIKEDVQPEKPKHKKYAFINGGINEVRERDNARKRRYYKNNTDECKTSYKNWQQNHRVYMRIRALITYYKKKWDIVEEDVQQYQWTPVDESLERLYDRLNTIKKKVQLVKAGRR